MPSDTKVPPAKEQENQIIRSLQSPKFNWRTADGIAKETGLDTGDVATVLENSPEVIRSSSANTAGEALYTLRDRYREVTPLMRRILDSIISST